MRNASPPHMGAVARLGLLLLLTVSGCGESGPVTAGAPAALTGPPVPVGPFLDGVFPPRTPNAPGAATWDIVSAFPAIDLGDTLVITSNPSNDMLYVGARTGEVRMFDNMPNVTSSANFIDLSDRVWPVWDGGFLGLAFHPEFGQPGFPFERYFYVYYSSNCDIRLRADGEGYETDLSSCDPLVPTASTSGFFGAYNRLSRFEVTPSGVGDPTSERVMINIRLYNGSHRGGGIVFRHEPYDGEPEPRRFMYLTIGDQFRYVTAQDIVGNLEGGTLRLQVDVNADGAGGWSCPAGSHLASRVYSTSLGHASDEVSGEWYCIPDDNHWAGVSGVFEEYCSVGHRNPHRLALDPVTNFMWSGEVGENTREEINIIECGNNYGWPFREGLTAGPRRPPSSYEGTLTDPILDFVRTEARAIIGGYVYRGSLFPELYGRYLAGDYVTGNIWAITLDESSMTGTKTYLASFDPGGLGTWGQDNDGEVYLGDVVNGGTLYTLDRVDQTVPDPPATLSATGAFADMAGAVPSDVWVPYGLNQPFWSDGAAKFRYIAVPNDGARDDPATERVAFSQNTDWTFPVGTVLMKHFELPIDEEDPSATDRLETRFLILGEDLQWYGLSYRWRRNLVDADLLDGADTSSHTISLAGGGTRDQTWNYPSRTQCLSCHRSMGVAGPRTHQLNGDFTYPDGTTGNQLAIWSSLDMFAPALDEDSIPSMLRSSALEDVTRSLEDRARSWLDSNCSNCHRPGEINAGFDARYTTPLEFQGLFGTAVRDDLGSPGMVVIFPGNPDLSAVYRRMIEVGPFAMPPLAKELPELPAVDVMREWIRRIDPNIAQRGVDYEYWSVAGSNLSSLPDFDGLGPADQTGVVNTFDISVRASDNDFVFRFSSYVQVQTGGDYTFYAGSDDGSRLYVDGAEVVNNDGLHAYKEVASAPITLAPGFYPILATMFEDAGNQALTVSWSGPDTGFNKEEISAADLYRTIPATVTNSPPTLQTPPDQSNLVNEAATLRLVGSDPDGDLAYYDAAGLPPGLTINHQSGRISGTISPNQAAATYPVTASISDGPEVTVVQFDWVVREERCGDGIVQSPEECEPPGTALCTDTCMNRAPICGDGFVTVPEQCDDGNLGSGDGCSSACLLEFCGDGVVNDDGAEECEPPGTALCTDTCLDRAPICGDGFVTVPEQCDDGNVVDGDGCSSSCTVEIPAGCGNGQLDAGELCDDGNLVGGDGCTANCLLEVCGDGIVNNGGSEDCEPPGTPLCTDGCEVRETLCGDGFRTPPEMCDDGNLVDGDGCASSCVFERCGDGVVNNGDAEDCEPPGTANCTDLCMTREPVCGDGFVTGNEECDDGNTFDDDGCSAVCGIETPPSCGDGMLDEGEECDDGGLEPGDGCSESCRLEDTPPPPPDDEPDSSSTGGGCSVSNRNGPLDPSAALIMLGALAIRRRRRRATGADVTEAASDLGRGRTCWSPADRSRTRGVFVWSSTRKEPRRCSRPRCCTSRVTRRRALLRAGATRREARSNAV